MTEVGGDFVVQLGALDKAIIGLEFVALVAPETAGERTPTHRYRADDKTAALAAVARGHVVGGVAWLWAAPDAEAKLDWASAWTANCGVS